MGPNVFQQNLCIFSKHVCPLGCYLLLSVGKPGKHYFRSRPDRYQIILSLRAPTAKPSERFAVGKDENKSKSNCNWFYIDE